MTCPLTIRPGTLISTRLIIREAPPRHGLLCFPSDRVSPDNLPNGCYFRFTRPYTECLCADHKKVSAAPESTKFHVSAHALLSIVWATFQAPLAPWAKYPCAGYNLYNCTWQPLLAPFSSFFLVPSTLVPFMGAVPSPQVPG